MAEVYIEGNESETFRGEYEFVEGGIDKNGKPGFHIDTSDKKGNSLSIFVEFKDLEEYKLFLQELREQIPEE